MAHIQAGVGCNGRNVCPKPAFLVVVFAKLISSKLWLQICFTNDSKTKTPQIRGDRAREIRRTLFFAFVSLKCRGFEIHGLEFSYSDYLFTSMFMSAHMVACTHGRFIREHVCFDVDEVNIC